MRRSRMITSPVGGWKHRVRRAAIRETPLTAAIAMPDLGSIWEWCPGPKFVVGCHPRRLSGPKASHAERRADGAPCILAIIWPEWLSRIVLAPEAAAALKAFPTPVRTGVREAIRRHLAHEPTKVSKSRIKRLRGLSQPEYRLRVDDIRVFYDVTETQVQVLAIVTKAEAHAWLDEQGTPAEDDPESGGPRGGEG